MRRPQHLFIPLLVGSPVFYFVQFFLFSWRRRGIDEAEEFQEKFSNQAPGERSPSPPRIPTRPGRSPPPVLDGIPLSGLPWPPAGVSSATFGLAPHGSAVSSRFPPTSGSPHHRPWWAGSRFCSGADRLRSRLLAPCVLLRGRNFPRRSPWPVHRLGSEYSRRGRPINRLLSGTGAGSTPSALAALSLRSEPCDTPPAARNLVSEK